MTKENGVKVLTDMVADFVADLPQVKIIHFYCQHTI